MNAIILDGHLKSALATVRSLGKAGVFVSAGAERGTAISLHSRYTNAHIIYPSPYTDEDAFVRAVKAEAVRIGGRPVVYTFSDATYLLLHTYRDDLNNFMTLIFPDEKSVGIAFDKAATYSLARISNVPTISTYTPANDDELERIASTLRYPAVLKPRQSVTRRNGTGTFGTATFVMDATELKARYSQMSSVVAPLIQERVIGEEYGVEMVAHEGKPLALVAHHRLRSLSPRGGASVLKEILGASALRDLLFAYAEKLALALSWEGPLMAEFKVDSDTRTPKLMELNGRFWGSLPLSIVAGVDMPLIYFKLATGGELPKEPLLPHEGVTTRHLMGDTVHLFRVLFSLDPMRSHLYPKRWQAVKDFFHSPKGTKGDIWSWSDPKPALMELIDVVVKFLGR